MLCQKEMFYRIIGTQPKPGTHWSFKKRSICQKLPSIALKPIKIHYLRPDKPLETIKKSDSNHLNHPKTTIQTIQNPSIKNPLPFCTSQAPVLPSGIPPRPFSLLRPCPLRRRRACSARRSASGSAEMLEGFGKLLKGCLGCLALMEAVSSKC